MRGLDDIRRMNDRAAANALAARYDKLEKRAARRGENRRASRYRNRALQFRLFLDGQLADFPDRARRHKRLHYPLEFAEKGIRCDPDNEALAHDLKIGKPVEWWFARHALRELTNGERQQLEELRGYYRLVTSGQIQSPTRALAAQ